jgi:hypothetical protein
MNEDLWQLGRLDRQIQVAGRIIGTLHLAMLVVGCVALTIVLLAPSYIGLGVGASVVLVAVSLLGWSYAVRIRQRALETSADIQARYPELLEDR